MIDLKPLVDARLWAAIENAYQNQNYTGAIQDSVQFLSDLIREKAGLDGDGTALVGQAFGGAIPKLKLNRLETVSEQDFRRACCKC